MDAACQKLDNLNPCCSRRKPKIPASEGIFLNLLVTRVIPLMGRTIPYTCWSSRT